jgi:bacterioferritin-associated ferredoxin
LTPVKTAWHLTTPTKTGSGFYVIVCSCNVLTDHDVRSAVATAAPRRAGEVYGCLGCSAQCGRCVRTIRRIMDEALCAAACTGCSRTDHSHS